MTWTGTALLFLPFTFCVAALFRSMNSALATAVRDEHLKQCLCSIRPEIEVSERRSAFTLFEGETWTDWHTHNLTIMSLFHVLHGNLDLGSISARNEYMNEKQHVMLLFGPVGYKTLIDLWWLRSVNREGML
jgi:hypothetical protein